MKAMLFYILVLRGKVSIGDALLRASISSFALWHTPRIRSDLSLKSSVSSAIEAAKD